MEKVDERLKEALLSAKRKVRVIVITEEGVTDRDLKRLKKLGGKLIDELPIIKGFSAEVPIGAVPKLAESSNVKRIFLDEEVSIGG